MSKLYELVQNFNNGNLTIAKRQARKHKIWAIRDAFVQWGYSSEKAMLTADWLKGRDCWQEACDAK